eukprot:66489-Chlamydomonas_euryale.AAC.1
MHVSGRGHARERTRSWSRRGHAREHKRDSPIPGRRVTNASARTQVAPTQVWKVAVHKQASEATRTDGSMYHAQQRGDEAPARSLGGDEAPGWPLGGPWAGMRPLGGPWAGMRPLGLAG